MTNFFGEHNRLEDSVGVYISIKEVILKLEGKFENLYLRSDFLEQHPEYNSIIYRIRSKKLKISSISLILLLSVLSSIDLQVISEKEIGKEVYFQKVFTILRDEEKKLIRSRLELIIGVNNINPNFIWKCQAAAYKLKEKWISTIKKNLEDISRVTSSTKNILP